MNLLQHINHYVYYICIIHSLWFTGFTYENLVSTVPGTVPYSILGFICSYVHIHILICWSLRLAASHKISAGSTHHKASSLLESTCFRLLPVQPKISRLEVSTNSVPVIYGSENIDTYMPLLVCDLRKADTISYVPWEFLRPIWVCIFLKKILCIIFAGRWPEIGVRPRSARWRTWR